MKKSFNVARNAVAHKLQQNADTVAQHFIDSLFDKKSKKSEQIYASLMDRVPSGSIPYPIGISQILWREATSSLYFAVRWVIAQTTIRDHFEDAILGDENDLDGTSLGDSVSKLARFLDSYRPGDSYEDVEWMASRRLKGKDGKSIPLYFIASDSEAEETFFGTPYFVSKYEGTLDTLHLVKDAKISDRLYNAIDLETTRFNTLYWQILASLPWIGTAGVCQLTAHYLLDALDPMFFNSTGSFNAFGEIWFPNTDIALLIDAANVDAKQVSANVKQALVGLARRNKNIATEDIVRLLDVTIPVDHARPLVNEKEYVGSEDLPVVDPVLLSREQCEKFGYNFDALHFLGEYQKPPKQSETEVTEEEHSDNV